MRRLGFLFLFWAAAGLGAEEWNRNQVTVTGQRLRRNLKDSTAAVEVIDRGQIEGSGALTAAEVLEKQPGIEVFSGIRGRNVRLQGLDPKYVLILVNGERIAGRVNDAIDISRIKADEIERIEIVKGAASALYGSDAMAGVINIITRESTRPVELDGTVGYGSGRQIHYGSGNETNASVFSGINNELLANQLTAGWHRSDGYDLTPLSQKSRLTEMLGPALPLFNGDEITRLKGTTGPAFQDLNLADRAQIHFTPAFQLGAGVSYRYLNEERTDVSLPRQLIERKNETHEFSGSIAPHFDLSNNTSLRLSYYNTRFFDRLSQDQKGSDELDKRETQDDRLQEFRAQLDRDYKNHVLSVGTDFLMEEFISERIAGRYAYKQRAALFVQDEWKAGSSWTIVPGLRQELDSQFGSQTTPKLQLRVDPASGLRIRAGAGAGFRAPSFKDLYLNFQNPGVGYQVRGNPDLKPERSRSYNASVEVEPLSWLYLTAGVFHNRISNLIDFKRTSSQSDLTTFQPANIKEAVVSGIETMAEARFASGFSAALGYTGTVTEDLSQHIPLPGRSVHRGTYRLEYFHKPSGAGFSVQGSVHGKQAFWYAKESIVTLASRGGYSIDTDVPLRAFLQKKDYSLFESNPDFPKNGYRMGNPYHNLDARLFIRFADSMEFFAGARNILDQYHTELNPARPRFYYFGLRMKYQKQEDPLRLLPQFESGRPLDGIE